MVCQPLACARLPAPLQLCHVCHAVPRARPPAWHASAICRASWIVPERRRRGEGECEPGRGLSGGAPGRGSHVPRPHCRSGMRGIAGAGGRGPGAHGFARARPPLAR